MFSDLALRVVDVHATIDEIANAYGISRAHPTKVVNALRCTGYLTAVRGRSGGLRLARPADQITEPDFALVECFAAGNRCVIMSCCRLQGVLAEALSEAPELPRVGPLRGSEVKSPEGWHQ